MFLSFCLSAFLPFCLSVCLSFCPTLRFFVFLRPIIRLCSLFKVRYIIARINYDNKSCSELLSRLSYYIHLAFNYCKKFPQGIEPRVLWSWVVCCNLYTRSFPLFLCMNLSKASRKRNKKKLVKLYQENQISIDTIKVHCWVFCTVLGANFKHCEQ